jgi:hypothetical protein
MELNLESARRLNLGVAKPSATLKAGRLSTLIDSLLSLEQPRTLKTPVVSFLAYF